MADAGDLIERLCVAAGMVMEDTAEAALIASASVDAEQRLALLLGAGANVTALATAAMVIKRRYADAQA
jgi:hypothetical protein